jgi:hypothetical protein
MSEKGLNQRISGQAKQTTWGQDGDRTGKKHIRASLDQHKSGQGWTRTGLDHQESDWAGPPYHHMLGQNEVRTGLDQYKLG